MSEIKKLIHAALNGNAGTPPELRLNASAHLK
jgi:hypothetical protein